jgi:anaerobic selenocysteine-containing dehydrogenase
VPRAVISDVDRARAIVLLGPDLKEELPVAYLRLRRAAEDLDVPLIELSAVGSGLSRYATVRLRHLPGEADQLAERLVDAVTGSGGPTGDADLDRAAALLAGGPAAALLPGGQAVEDEKCIVVVLGRPSVAEPAGPTVRAAAALLRLPGTRFLSALRRGNVHGAVDLGLVPGMLPGRVALDAGRAWFEAAWGGVPVARGLDTEGILQAAADGRIEALVLLGADPASDFPDRDLARRALDRVPFILAVDAFPTASSERAHVVLPVALYGEKRGTTTNMEGRLQRLARKVTPPGTAMEDWRVAAELALRLGADFDLEAVDEVTDEIARLAGAYRGADAGLLRRAVDGVVVPVGETEEPVLDAKPHTVSPQADADAGVTGGPVESLVTVGGPAAGFGLVPPGVGEAQNTLRRGADVSGGYAAPGPAEGPSPEPGREPPPPYEWDGTSEAAPADRPPGEGLRLVATRPLYDGGVAVTRSPSIAGLAHRGTVSVHPADAERLGLTPGGPVRVTSARGSITLPLRTDPAVAPGVAAIPFNPPGPGAGDLVELGRVTEVRLAGEAEPDA